MDSWGANENSTSNSGDFGTGAQHERTTGSGPHQQQTLNYKKIWESLDGTEARQRVFQVLELLNSLDLNLPVLLWAISWNVSSLISDDKVRFARTALVASDLLPGILKNWYRPPRAHGLGIRSKAAHHSMDAWAVDTVCETLDKESESLKEVLSYPQGDLSQDTLLSIKWEAMISDVKALAPLTWKLFHHTAWTKQQEERNTYKNPDAAVLTMVSVASLSRSHHSCKLAKLLTIYFKSCGMATKAFDTLHALGITMSQKWVYDGINSLAQQQNTKLLKDIESFPWFGTHDNVNIPFRVFQQRLGNRSHFDSGTAATIVVLKDPSARWPDRDARINKRALGAADPISHRSIMQIEKESSPHLLARATYLVLQFLTRSSDFDFNKYSHKDDPVFGAVPSRCQLPTGSEAGLPCQYVLKTVHIEEASYEGNDRVLAEWWRQLQRDAYTERRKMGENDTIIWAGDQLTVSRLRGLQSFRCEDHNSFDRLDFLVPVFGWFHLQIAMEHSIHAQYYGTQQGFGLVHAFDLLKRKGLHSPSVQGTFHNHLREALLHIAEARFRDLWCVVGKVDSLAALRQRSPTELSSLAQRIVKEFASSSSVRQNDAVNGRGRDDLYCQSVQMARDLLEYVSLDQALTSGDVGHLQDMLPRLLYRFAGGSSKNYTTEVLEVLQGLNREWPDDLCDYIRRNCWLINTTGKPDAFEPLDLMQEHNVRDIKYTFASSGPYADWEYIGKISASIPCQRSVKDHVEASLNHFRRGKTHTSPSKDEDITRLQASYSASKVHIKVPGRTLESKHIPKDYLTHGMEKGHLTRIITRWKENRVSERANKEKWANA